MKVLLLNGSPNEHGCTYTALCEVARALEESGVETETLWIGNRAVRGCIGCGGCAKNGRRRCVFEDDLVNAALDRMQACDGLVVGSPVHYAAAGGSITSFLDRMFYAGGSQLRTKVGAAVQRAPRGHDVHARSAFQILHHLRHADCAQPVLADGARKHAGRRSQGRGRLADHAHVGEKYGVYDPRLCPCARKRAASARNGEAKEAHEFHPLTASILLDV